MVVRDVMDGVPVVRKRTGYDARTEAAGLRALGDAGAHVPHVVAVDEHELVTEEVAGDGDWAACGRRLAAVHATTGDRFGWERDGVIGVLAMSNSPDDDWPRFYARRRLLPYLDALPGVPATRLRRAIDDGRLARLLDHDVAPSLVHGDLWSGNVVGGQWLIDPAVHRADRELDLAFARVFGGFPSRFFAAYEEVAPLDDGWRDRVPALQLFHLLVHVEAEGPGYVRSVIDRLDRLGW